MSEARGRTLRARFGAILTAWAVVALGLLNFSAALAIRNFEAIYTDLHLRLPSYTALILHGRPLLIAESSALTLTAVGLFFLRREVGLFYLASAIIGFVSLGQLALITVLLFSPLISPPLVTRQSLSIFRQPLSKVSPYVCPTLLPALFRSRAGERAGLGAG